MKQSALKSFIPKSIKELYRFVLRKKISIGLSKNGSFIQPEQEAQACSSMSIIVPIADAPEHLLRCLRSLEMYAANAEIILIDDNSKLEETLDVIKTFYHRNNWKHVRHESSLGHSRSCEHGISLATRPYICLLNSDTVVTPWSWSAINEAFESYPKIAVVGPSTSWAATKQLVSDAKYCRHYWNDSQIFSFAEKYIEKHNESPLVDLKEISGFAYFIRREAWDCLGGFDKNLPDYGNESELNIRLIKSGWRLVWTPKSYIHHFGRSSYKTSRRLKQDFVNSYIKDKHAG